MEYTPRPAMNVLIIKVRKRPPTTCSYLGGTSGYGTDSVHSARRVQMLLLLFLSVAGQVLRNHRPSVSNTRGGEV